MEFGPVDVLAAEGCLLAHGTRAGTTVLRKGHKLTRSDLELLAAEGHTSVVVARLAPGDLDEDQAADRLARAALGPGLRKDLEAATGRVNLYAETAGVFVADRAAVDAMNRVDPALTLATLRNHSRVEPGRMVATAKVIEFAASAEAVAAAESAIRDALRIAPFQPRRIGLVATRLPHLKESVLDKTRRVLEARLAGTGSTVLEEIRSGHRAEEVAAALARLKDMGCDLFLLFGASAVVDRHDVLPSALRLAGGVVDRFGIPVDPGNLLLTGRLAGHPVICAPGCARSPKENGFDWVLERTLAGVAPGPEEMTGWGVGGLLMEIQSRPHPREQAGDEATVPEIAAILLAAGQSRRMGTRNKLLEEISGKPMIRHVAEAATGVGFCEVVVVTGHEEADVRAALDGLDVRFVANPDYLEGMGTSVAAGIRALCGDPAGAMVLLGDMPALDDVDLTRLITTFREHGCAAIVAAGSGGERGNPVLWPRAYFGDISRLEGDRGARTILQSRAEEIILVEAGAAARLDLDTPESLENYRNDIKT